MSSAARAALDVLGRRPIQRCQLIARRFRRAPERIRVAIKELAAMPRPSLPVDLEQALDARDWEAATRLGSYHYGLSLAIELVLSEPKLTRWPSVLELFLAGCEYPVEITGDFAV